MPIDPIPLWRQINLGADSGLELKEARFRHHRVSWPGEDDLANALAAFANAEGGRLVLGVADDRRPQSLDASQLDALADFVKEICSDKIQPALDFRLHRVPVPEADKQGVLVVDVPPGVTVHRSPGGYFRRRGDSRRQMGAEEIRRLTQARGQSDAAATDTQVVDATSARSLQPGLWRRYASSRSNDPEDVLLRKLKFLKEDPRGIPRATAGGVLLGTDDPTQWLANAYVQAVCYTGTRADAARQLDAQDISGPLDQQIAGAMRFVLRNRRVAARKDPARVDLPQYSERAVFEAIVNAVVHRDYAISGSRIRLFMFDDRLELYSPGALCNSMTTDDLRTSQFTRNELLASRLGQCPVGDIPGAGEREYFIERRGEGVAVIEDETFALAGRRPDFEVLGERELRLMLSYLYADNVAIDDGKQQPVHFRLNEPLRLTDSLGVDVTLWFREMVGASCVFDYRGGSG